MSSRWGFGDCFAAFEGRKEEGDGMDGRMDFISVRSDYVGQD